jgi:exopolysaccharide production protein ExoZ
MRAVAALLVVLLHAIDVVDGAPGAFAGKFLPTIPNFNDFGACGVDLFFVISGFAMAASLSNSQRSGWQFLRQRFIRVVPLYWLAAGGYVLILALLGQPNAYDGLLNTLTILPLTDVGHYESPPLYVGWTLMFEFIFYGLVTLVLMLNRTRPLAWLFAVTATCATLSVFCDGPIIARILFNPIFVEFLLGIIAFALWRSGLPEGLAVSALVIGLTALAAEIFLGAGLRLSVHFDAVISGESGLARTIMWGLPWFGVLIGVVCATRTAPAPLRMVGDASFSIYLTHLFVITAAQEALRGITCVSPYLGAVTIVLIATALGIVTHRHVEVPLLGWLIQRSTTEPPPPTLIARAA